MKVLPYYESHILVTAPILLRETPTRKGNEFFNCNFRPVLGKALGYLVGLLSDSDVESMGTNINIPVKNQRCR